MDAVFLPSEDRSEEDISDESVPSKSGFEGTLNCGPAAPESGGGLGGGTLAKCDFGGAVSTLDGRSPAIGPVPNVP